MSDRVNQMSAVQTEALELFRKKMRITATHLPLMARLV